MKNTYNTINRAFKNFFSYGFIGKDFISNKETRQKFKIDGIDPYKFNRGRSKHKLHIHDIITSDEDETNNNVCVYIPIGTKKQAKIEFTYNDFLNNDVIEIEEIVFDLSNGSYNEIYKASFKLDNKELKQFNILKKNIKQIIECSKMMKNVTIMDDEDYDSLLKCLKML